MKIETWKEIVGYKGYRISSFGNAISTWRRKDHEWVQIPERPKPLKHSISKKGYHMIRLQSEPRNQKLVCVHVLMLKTFVGPKPTIKHHACHIDDNKDRNVIDNLEWNTPDKNLQSRFINHGGPKLNRTHIPKVFKLLKSGLNQTQVANRLGVTQGHISRIAAGLNWNHV